jgi:hypothetical protein
MQCILHVTLHLCQEIIWVLDRKNLLTARISDLARK